MVVLFINAVDGNFEKSFLSIEFVFSIVFRESDGYIYAVARVMADELFFKVIDVNIRRGFFFTMWELPPSLLTQCHLPLRERLFAAVRLPPRGSCRRRRLRELLFFPPPHHAHAQRIGAGVHGNGAADLQQDNIALAGGVLGAQGGAGLHPEPLALVGIVAVAHRDAVVVGRAVVLGQIGHQQVEGLLKALLAAAGPGSVLAKER